ncbi:hypothetical protein FVE85_6576 [Porphyridium purpureum]|uniref:Mitotic-spindle organizing protein 1 n=1 Tax=Porphyridium purpureum TaxID=35688 RepID=A0A5J4Z537_PORPP|nr:hypothetical protein FVE85_6576 [Porphyridium purpureum]|eukprot:POR1863..scf295_1
MNFESRSDMEHTNSPAGQRAASAEDKDAKARQVALELCEVLNLEVSDEILQSIQGLCHAGVDPSAIASAVREAQSAAAEATRAAADAESVAVKKQ